MGIKYGEKIVIRSGEHALIEATCVGAFRKLSGEEFVVFENDNGMIYIKPRVEVEKPVKVVPPMDMTKGKV